MNIARHLEQGAATWPERRALVDLDASHGRRELSYAELWLRVRYKAAGLIGLGLRKGDRVALLLANSAEYVESFLAIASAGLVAVPLNIRLLEDELAYMLRDSGTRVLIAGAEQLSGRPGLAQIAGLRTVIAGAVSDAAGREDYRFEALTGDEPITLANVPEDALCSIMYTSGTTGAPKGVMLSHRAWDKVADLVRHYLGYQDDEVTLHVAPLTHGAGFLLLPTLSAGGVNLVTARFDAHRTLHLFRDEGVTNIFVVPSILRMLLDAAGAEPVEKFALRCLYYAGSPIDAGTLRDAMSRFGPVLVQSYGQMEAPMFLSVLDRAEHAKALCASPPRMLASAGVPVAGVDLEIVDEHNTAVAPGMTGEIIAKAPQMMSGYWGRADATAQTLVDGWLHTGDLGRFDEAGYLYVVDRKKDMIITGGSNVYAREVEEVLLELDGIKEVAVIGLPHEKWGEAVAAVVVSADGNRPSNEQIDRYARSRLADYRRPKHYFWVEALPRNPYGKVLKRALRDRYTLPGSSADGHAQGGTAQ